MVVPRRGSVVRKALDAERMHAQNSQVIDEFRRNGGHVGGNFEGAPVLLHTIGAKSGTERINPMMYQQVGDAYAVFASAAGDDDHPAWFQNRAVFDGSWCENATFRSRPRGCGSNRRLARGVQRGVAIDLHPCGTDEMLVLRFVRASSRIGRCRLA